MQSWQIAEKYIEDTVEKCRCEYGNPWMPAVLLIENELSRIMIDLQASFPDAYVEISKRLTK